MTSKGLSRLSQIQHLSVHPLLLQGGILAPYLILKRDQCQLVLLLAINFVTRSYTRNWVEQNLRAALALIPLVQPAFSNSSCNFHQLCAGQALMTVLHWDPCSMPGQLCDLCREASINYMPEQHQAFPTLQLTQAQGSTGQEMIIQVKGCQHHHAIGSCHFYIMRHLLVLSTQTLCSEALMTRLVGDKKRKKSQTVRWFWEVAHEPKVNESSEICKYIFLVHHFSSSQMQMASCVALSSANKQYHLKAKKLNRLPRDLVDAPCLETLKTKLDRALSNLI